MAFFPCSKNKLASFSSPSTIQSWKQFPLPSLKWLKSFGQSLPLPRVKLGKPTLPSGSPKSQNKACDLPLPLYHPLAMNISLTSDESALLSRVSANAEKKITKIEKTESQFRVHYNYLGGTASEAIVYNLAASMAEAVQKIRELKKAIA
jgi:hypothetical protein